MLPAELESDGRARIGRQRAGFEVSRIGELRLRSGDATPFSSAASCTSPTGELAIRTFERDRRVRRACWRSANPERLATADGRIVGRFVDGGLVHANAAHAASFERVASAPRELVQARRQQRAHPDVDGTGAAPAAHATTREAKLVARSSTSEKVCGALAFCFPGWLGDGYAVETGG